jgi:hypothetical protein
MLKVSMFSKSSLIATIVALALASVSATSVFAASSKSTTPHQQGVVQNLQSDWKSDKTSLHAQVLMVTKVQAWAKAWLKDNTTTADKSKANDLVSRFNSTLRQTQSIVSKHAGFNSNGVVTDSTLASKSVTDLGNALHQLNAIMRQIRVQFA